MISQFFPVIMLLTCVLGIMELNCLPRFGDKKKKKKKNNNDNENENLFSRAFVVHKIAKQIISRRRGDENTCKKLCVRIFSHREKFQLLTT